MDFDLLKSINVYIKALAFILAARSYEKSVIYWK